MRSPSTGCRRRPPSTATRPAALRRDPIRRQPLHSRGMADQPQQRSFEKLGVFFLGREYDLAAKRARDDAALVLYDSKDLVTHAVCVGMTGSGKTGLCIGLLE